MFRRCAHFVHPRALCRSAGLLERLRAHPFLINALHLQVPHETEQNRRKSRRKKNNRKKALFNSIKAIENVVDDNDILCLQMFSNPFCCHTVCFVLHILFNLSTSNCAVVHILYFFSHESCTMAFSHQQPIDLQWNKGSSNSNASNVSNRNVAASSLNQPYISTRQQSINTNNIMSDTKPGKFKSYRPFNTNYSNPCTMAAHFMTLSGSPKVYLTKRSFFPF